MLKLRSIRQVSLFALQHNSDFFCDPEGATKLKELKNSRLVQYQVMPNDYGNLDSQSSSFSDDEAEELTE